MKFAFLCSSVTMAIHIWFTVSVTPQSVSEVLWSSQLFPVSLQVHLFFFPFSVQFFAPVLWNFSWLIVSCFSSLSRPFFSYPASSLASSSRLGASYVL